MLDKTFTRKLHNGSYLYVTPAEHIQQQLFWYGFYEKNAILTWEAFTANGGVVADIGANIGYYSIIAAKNAKTVYAFEPSAAVLKLLKQNLQLNNTGNVKVSGQAMGSESGIATLFISHTDNTGMTSLAQPENFSGQTQPVHVARFDDWCSDNTPGAIELIKIDAEGAEMNILDGMQETIVQYQPVIFAEVLDVLLAKFGHTKEDIFTFFRNHSYQAYTIAAPLRLQPAAEPVEAEMLVFIPKGKTIPSSIQVH